MPHPQRLLFVSHEMTLSGAPIQLAYLVQWLHAHRWSTTVLAPEPGPLEDMLSGIEIIYEPTLLRDPTYAALRGHVPHYDLVIANTIATWQAVQVAQLEKVPVIWYVHETQVGRELMKIVHMIEPSLEIADVVVTPTAATARAYSAFRGKPIDVIPYAIPAVKARRRTRAERITFAVIGTYELRKGQDVFVEAVRQLPDDVRANASFKLAGRPLDESFSTELRRVPNVELLDSLGHDEAMQLLADTDVLVCASRDETMPIVLLEAMSLAKPIICTRVGGVEEWMRDGENAILVPPTDARALAGAIELVARDAKLRKKLGAHAHKTFKRHFRLSRYAKQFAALIKKTLKP